MKWLSVGPMSTTTRGPAGGRSLCFHTSRTFGAVAVMLSSLRETLAVTAMDRVLMKSTAIAPLGCGLAHTCTTDGSPPPGLSLLALRQRDGCCGTCSVDSTPVALSVKFSLKLWLHPYTSTRGPA